MSLFSSSFKCLFIYLSIALVVMHCISPPVGVGIVGWKAFVIFAFTLTLIISKTYDMGIVALIALSFIVISQTLTIEEALLKFSYPVTWLVVLAFFLSKGFILSGLGARIALGISASVGTTPLRLAYALIGAEVVIAPFIPSNTARGGGLIYPLALSLGRTIFGDQEGSQKNYRQWSAYLMYSCFQANLISSALFLTAMAGNPMVASFAIEVGFNLTWISWFSGAVVPGAISLFLTPLILMALIRPNGDIPKDVSKHVKQAYHDLGPVKHKEKIMGFVFIFLLAAWMLGPFIGIHPTSAAFLGVTTLLILDVMSWKDVAADDQAWTTFIWLTVVFTLTTAMREHGFVEWAAERMAEAFPVMHPKWLLAALMCVNFYSHYFFASLTSHIATIFQPLLLLGLQMNIPIRALVYGLAFSTSLSGGLTHYGTGSGTIAYVAGYWSLKEWWVLGLIQGTIVLSIFILCGFPLWF